MVNRLLVLVLGLALLPSAPAQARAIGVTTLADSLAADGACSLREAIVAANTDSAVDACPAGSGADNIQLAAGTYALTLAGAGEDAGLTGDLDITSAITLQGIDKNTTAIDAAGLGDRIIEAHPGARLALSGLALAHGGDAANPALDGGAIYSAGALELRDAELAFHAAGRNGGAIFSAGGAITVTGSIIRDSQAGTQGQSSGAGGGLFIDAGTALIATSIINNNSSHNGYGGGIRNRATLRLLGSWVHDNTTNTRGGGIYNSATAVITGTVLDANRAGHDGGNLYSGADDESPALTLASSELRAGQARYGGGIFNQGALEISSVSFALNTADQGGALYTAALTATVRLRNATLAENTQQDAAPGAAITSVGAPIQLRNTLIGRNGADASCSGPIASAGHNLDRGASCGLEADGDLPNTDPLLGPLPAVSQTPDTFPLLLGSPAVNAGDNGGCAAHDIVQRPRPHGLACDIGAYEWNTGPSALADAYTLAEDTQLIVAAPGLLGNDSDPEGDPLAALRVSWPTQGALALGASGGFSYTPPANFYGSDQFAYQASDGAFGSPTVVVQLTITPVNDAPTAGPDAAATTRATPLAIPAATLLANDSDIEGDGLFVSAVSARSARGGHIVLDGTSVYYTAPLGFSGADSFGYTVSDGHGGTASGSVAVDVRLRWVFAPIVRR